ncbi:MAG: 2OG-Fe(II) oxygenase [Bryobacteraceae bacterium]|nr:2OG-Fe(II) oxygenase [Bryobacteraceae bacterium]
MLRDWPIAANRDAFANARPFRHVIIDNFLSEEFCAALLREFPAFDQKQALNEMGLPGAKAVVEKLPQIGPAYRQFDTLIQSPEFLAKIEAITGIPRLLYDPHYFGGGTHENRHGQDLDIHVDFNYHPKTHTHRRLNLIIFLNPRWEAAWGGCLELRRDPWGAPEDDEVVSVVPLLNRCVIFETTETSWHGFRRVQVPDETLSRRSLAIYYYTAERPAAETAPAHSTVYVPWRMPAHLRAGHTLTEADVDALDEQFSRRNELLRFLYEREKEFTEVRESLLNSHSYRLSRALLAPAIWVKRWMNGSAKGNRTPI